jgi:F-type H+-transporting ATPase subunit gamma
MAKTRQIRKRIISVRNIHKITHTMERVAQSKGLKLSNRYESAASFQRNLARLLPEALGAATGSTAAKQELAVSTLGARRAETKRVLLFCVTSSRGLCGGYNARVIQAARALMGRLAAEGKEPLLAVMGKKGLAYFRFHQVPLVISLPDADENIPYAALEQAGAEVVRRFTTREFDEVRIVSTRMRTRVVQEVTEAELLPFSVEEASFRGPSGPGPSTAAAAVGGAATGPTMGPGGEPLYLVEPDRLAVLERLLPLLVKGQLFCAVLEAMMCEQAQRSVAMRSASDNADSMTKRLTRTYNRARQAQITNEMIEIISGSEGGR